jgi:hypothetical protein
MLKLYRGLVEILTKQCEKLNSEFINHIRKFNDGEGENNFGVKGFWNLLLEIVFVLFVKLFIASGVLMTLIMAIIFFPLHALKTSITNILNHRAEFVPEEINYQEPKLEKK